MSEPTRTPWNHPLWAPLENVLSGLEKVRLNARNPVETVGGCPENQNIDPGELLRFEAAAHQWWDPRGPSGALHAINPLRLCFIANSGPLKNQQVLDVGCGGGLLSEALARKGARVTGIDRGRTALGVARSHARDQGLAIDYHQATAESWAGNYANHYDLVVCMELLEHVPDGGSVIDACAGMARPGGRVVFATLNRNLKSYIFAILGGEYILKLLPPRTHDWRRFVPPQELIRRAAGSGLAVDGAGGFTYNPFTGTYRLVRDMSVNYMLALGKPPAAGKRLPVER